MYRLSLPLLLLTLACKGGPATDKEVELVREKLRALQGVSF